MISIITATIGRDLLKRAIDSVNKQTYTDWEHVVVFDGVTPPSDWILPESDRGPRRVFVHMQEQHFDWGKTAHNVGVCTSRGEFVAMLDDDNEWLPNHLESLIKPLMEDPEVQITFCPLTMVHVNYDNIITERHFSSSQGKVDTGNWIARREVLYKHGLFWSRARRSHDWKMLEKIFNAKEKYVVVPERTFLYSYAKKP